MADITAINDELKNMQPDKYDNASGPLGWFDCFTVGNGNNDMLVIGMVENIQDNADGGSHYLIKMIRTLFEQDVIFHNYSVVKSVLAVKQYII